MSTLCGFSETELRAFLHGDLADDRVRALAEHLRNCPECGLAVARIDGLGDTALDVLRGAGDNARTVAQGAAAPAAAAPRRVGEYELLGPLGQGGMGVVYKARHLRLRRDAAVKLMKAGKGAAAEMRDRFRREAEAMARLQHRNIVQIFEAGEEDGVPFLVMEYVDGATLARTLAGTPLPPRDAAALVRALAEAVAYAHQRGVLHRDLTPANVLLAFSHERPASAEGRALAGRSRLNECDAKITDFGLARLLVDDTALTQTGVVMGTPSYLAPEQAEGKKAVGPPADVYALGALLYDCLTGRPPFKAATALDTLKQVVHDEPVPPRRLQPQVPRDLETICLKCLEKAPPRRYAGAADLARDLAHFLAGEPIGARRPGPLGRAARWARRRPLVAALLLALGLVTAGGFGLVTWKWREAVAQRGRAEREEDEARRQRQKAEERLTQACDTIDEMLTRVGADTLAGVPHAEAVRRDLLDRAVKALEVMRQREGDDPHVRAKAAYACRRTAELLKDLSRPEEAVPLCRRAIELQAALADGFPSEPAYRAELAMSHGTLATLLSATGQPDEADREYREAAAIQGGLIDDFPDRPGFRFQRAVTLSNRAMLLRQMRRPDEAEQAQRAAQEIEKDLADEHPAETRYRYALAASHYALGNLLNAGRRGREAADEYRAAIKLLEALAAEQPDLPVNRHLLGQARHNLANLLPADAREKEIRQARELHQRLVEDYSGVPSYRAQLAWHCADLGRLLKAAKPAEAEGAFGEAVKHYRRLARDFPENSEYQSALGRNLGDLAALLRTRGESREARGLFEEAVAHQQAALKAEPNNTYYRGLLRDHWWGLGDALGALGDHAAMAKAAAEVPPLDPDGWSGRFEAARLLLWCVAQAARDERLGAGERQARLMAYARQGRDLLLGALPREPDNHGVWYHLALFEAVLEDGDGYRRACRDMDRRFGADKDVIARHWVARAASAAPDSGLDPARTVGLAEEALKTAPQAYFYLAWTGAALYRAGRYPQALERLEAAGRAHGAGGAGFDLTLRALAHQRLGDAEKARQRLAEARRWQERMEKKELNDPVFGREMWANQQTELWLLRREAERLVTSGRH